MNKTRSKAPSTGTKPALKATAVVAAPRRKTAARKPASGPWSEIANFVLNFESRQLRSGREERRITAHKMQEGGITATWIGAEQHPMCQWIAEHVGEGSLDEQAAATAGDPPSRPARSSAVAQAVPIATAASAVRQRPAAPVDIAIAQLRAVPVHAAVPAAEGPGPAAASTHPRVDAGAAFDIEAMLDVHGDDGAVPGSAIEPRCPIEFYLRNLATAQKSCLGSVASAERVDGSSRYAATLRQVQLPAGTYRIDCATRTPGAERPFAYLQGPVLDVA